MGDVTSRGSSWVVSRCEKMAGWRKAALSSKPTCDKGGGGRVRGGGDCETDGCGGKEEKARRGWRGERV